MPMAMMSSMVVTRGPGGDGRVHLHQAEEATALQRPLGLGTSSATVAQAGAVHVTVDVTNTGTRAGDDVVQLYVRYPESKVARPLKQLRGFKRVSLAPGETKTVTLPLAAADLSYWDTAQKAWIVEPGPVELLVGRSSADADLTLRQTITVAP